MNQDSILTEVILSNNHQSLGKIKLDWNPKKGSYLDLEGETYSSSHTCEVQGFLVLGVRSSEFGVRSSE